MKTIELMRNITGDYLDGDALKQIIKLDEFKNLDEFKDRTITVIELTEVTHVPTIVIYQNELEWSFADNVQLYSIRLVNKGYPELELIAFRVTPDSIKKIN